MTEKEWRASAIFIDGEKSTGTQKYEAAQITLDDENQEIKLINEDGEVTDFFRYDNVLDFSLRLKNADN